MAKVPAEPKKTSKQPSSKESVKLPSAFRLLMDAFRTIGRNWKTFGGIILVYALLNILMVQGLNAATDLSEAKSIADETFDGGLAGLATGLTLFTYLLGNSGGTASASAGTYQIILALIISLALIWALRQIYAGHKIRIRDSFYRGMAPLIPYVLVLLVVVVQLVPMTVGLLAYSTVISSGIVTTAWEHVLWLSLAFVLSFVSLYLVSSSIFASYIATLPNMTPFQALRSARGLVAHWRWSVIRKLVFLPLALAVLAVLIVMPVILLATPLSASVFFVVSLLVLPVIHSYMYALYRSML